MNRIAHSEKIAVRLQKICMRYPLTAEATIQIGGGRGVGEQSDTAGARPCQRKIERSWWNRISRPDNNRRILA